MSALFNFHSFLTVVLLVICTCTFLKMQFPTILEQKTGGEAEVKALQIFKKTNKLQDPYVCVHLRNADISAQKSFWPKNKHHLTISSLSICTVLTFRGFFWKAARIGERLSPWVAVGCFTMGVSIIFF